MVQQYGSNVHLSFIAMITDCAFTVCNGIDWQIMVISPCCMGFWRSISLVFLISSFHLLHTPCLVTQRKYCLHLSNSFVASSSDFISFLKNVTNPNKIELWTGIVWCGFVAHQCTSGDLVTKQVLKYKWAEIVSHCSAYVWPPPHDETTRSSIWLWCHWFQLLLLTLVMECKIHVDDILSAVPAD